MNVRTSQNKSSLSGAAVRTEAPGGGRSRSLDVRAGRPMEESSGAVQKLGHRVQQLRKDRGWTLDELAQRSTVSRSTLSKIEREEVSPTYEVIQRLAGGFEMDVAQFFGSSKQTSVGARRAVYRGEEGEIHQGRGYLYRLICAELSTKKMLPYRATILARSLEDAGGFIHHSGEECLFVLSGTVAFHTEHYAPVELQAGDAVYIDSNMGHACVSLSEEPAEVFWVTVDHQG